ncbi:MAG: hypothetical protein ACREBR_03030 [bacterium]
MTRVVREAIRCPCHTEGKKKAKSISQHLIEPTYWLFSFAGCPHGIHGSMPYEILHLFLLGIMKYILRSLFNHRSVPTELRNWYTARCARNGNQGAVDKRPTNISAGTSIFNKPEFERRFRVVTRAATRQSDRNMPRVPFRNGVTSLTRLTGQEYTGLSMLTMVCMEGIVNGDREVAGTIEKQYCRLIWLSLSLETLLTKESYSEEDLQVLDMTINYFLHELRELVGPQREMDSKCGLRIDKFHALRHFTSYIRRSPQNFSGIYLEAALKPFVKQPTKRTTRQHRRFILDLMHRYHERMIIDVAQKRKSFQAVDNLSPSNMDYQKELSLSDEFGTKRYAVTNPDFMLTKDNTNGGFWCTSIKNKSYTRAFHPLLDNETGASWILSICQKADEIGALRILCYYKLYTAADDITEHHNILRCHPDFLSYPWEKRGWYDWVMIRWESSEDDAHYENAARLCLWGELCIRTNNDAGVLAEKKEMVGVIQSLRSSNEIPLHSCMHWMHADHLMDAVMCVEFSSVQSEAYVLPAMSPLETLHRGRKTTDDRFREIFLDNPDLHRYFVIIPPRNDWANVGWPDFP